MQAARKEWNQMIKCEPKLAAVCAGLLDLLCSVDKPFYHQHMKMICAFDIPVISLQKTARKSLMYVTKRSIREESQV